MILDNLKLCDKISRFKINPALTNTDIVDSSRTVDKTHIFPENSAQEFLNKTNLLAKTINNHLRVRLRRTVLNLYLGACNEQRARTEQRRRTSEYHRASVQVRD